MKTLNVVYMGTPLFSIKPLKRLIEETNVIGVVTQRDALVGRRKILTPSEVKSEALKYNIKVLTPNKIREEYQEIIDLNPDIIITCAYGQIIPKQILDAPKYGAINIHASLLPKYRGGAPIHHALLNGDKETGITIMYMNEKMDAGDIILSEKINIDKDDNLETLSDKLSELGARLIIDVLPSIIRGENKRITQDESLVTFSPIIKRKDELINFNKTAEEIMCQIKAFSPQPLPYFVLNDTEFKVAEANVVPFNEGSPGVVISVDKESMTIQTGRDALRITKIKPKGKNTMKVSDFFNGNKREKFLKREVNNEGLL